jgi:caffeoyl-CoA O-methyltransferase
MPSNKPFILKRIQNYVQRNNDTRVTEVERNLDKETATLQEKIAKGVMPGQSVHAMETQSQMTNFLEMHTHMLGGQHDRPMKALDIGTFTGRSALAIAKAMPHGGKVISCDTNDKFAGIAQKYWQQAGMQDRIELKLAPANDTLQTLLDNKEAGTFDLVFIDADKKSYGSYYEKALELLRPGGLIIIDNTLWSGWVADPKRQDDDTVALRTLNEKVSHDTRVHHNLLSADDGIMVVEKLEKNAQSKSARPESERDIMPASGAIFSHTESVANSRPTGRNHAA